MTPTDVTNFAVAGASLATLMGWLLLGVRNVISFLVILLVGWIIAGVVSTIVLFLLRRARFNDFLQRSGAAELIRRTGVTADPAAVVAEAIKWLVRLVFLVAASDTVGLSDVSLMIRQLLYWIPKLVAAIVVLMIGGLLANVFSRLVRGATSDAGIGSPEFLATLARVAVWGAAIIVAANQIGVGQMLVNVLFIGLVFALSLAFGLAFGLGGRDTAAQILSVLYARNAGAWPHVVPVADPVGQASTVVGSGTAPVIEGTVVDESWSRNDPGAGGSPIR